MEVRVLQILLALAFITSVPSETITSGTLNLFIKISKNFIRNAFDDENIYEKSVNDACLNESLKLSVNGDRIVSKGQGYMLFSGALEKCLTISKEQAWNLFMDYLVGYFETITEDDKFPLACFQWKLQQLEPTSKLIEGFAGHVDMDECTSIIDGPITLRNIKELEQGLGKLETFTCNAVNVDEVKKMFVKLALITARRDDDDMRKAEIESYKNNLKDKFERTYKCVLESVDFL